MVIRSAPAPLSPFQAWDAYVEPRLGGVGALTNRLQEARVSAAPPGAPATRRGTYSIERLWCAPSPSIAEPVQGRETPRPAVKLPSDPPPVRGGLGQGKADLGGEAHRRLEERGDLGA